MNISDLRISIIGYGKLASGIYAGLRAAGAYPAIAVHSENSRARALSDNIPEESIINGVDKLPVSDIYLIATQDSEIKHVADDLVKSLGSALQGKFVSHFSASLSIDLLNTCKKYGAHIASIHPFQTFYRGSQTNLKEIAWGIDCEVEDSEFLTEFINKIGGKGIILPDNLKGNKPLYHLSAVAVSNLTAAAFALGKLFAHEAGIDPCIFFPAIARETIENNIQMLNNDDIAITGPITRGDTAILKAHLNSLVHTPELSEAYRLMSQATALMAHSTKIISDETFDEISTILQIKEL